MSGTPVPGWVLLLAWLGAASLAWSLAERERGPLLVGSLTVGAQALMHFAFSLGHTVALPGANSPSAHGSSDVLPHAAAEHHAASADAGAMAGHAHHTHHAGAAMGDPAGGAHGMANDGMGATSGMIAAHVLVALLSAWWLRGGERAVFRAVRAASVRLFAPLVLVLGAELPAPVPVARLRWRERRRAPRKLSLSHVIWLRGPPCDCAV